MNRCHLSCQHSLHLVFRFDAFDNGEHKIGVGQIYLTAYRTHVGQLSQQRLDKSEILGHAGAWAHERF